MIECIKDWIINGVVIFEKGEFYPYKNFELNGDNRTKGYKMYEDTYGFKIWFWSGSEYFNIDYIGNLDF